MTADKKHPLPALTYAQSMSMVVVTQPGQTCLIRDCPAPRFLVLAKRAAQSARSGEATAKALTTISGLDVTNQVDRWYIMLCLLELGAKPFWSAHEQATAQPVVQT